MATKDDVVRLLYAELSHQYGTLFRQAGDEVRTLKFAEFMGAFEKVIEPRFQIFRKEPGTHLIPARIERKSLVEQRAVEPVRS